MIIFLGMCWYRLCDVIDFSHALAVMLREEDLPSLNYWVPLILLVIDVAEKRGG